MRPIAVILLIATVVPLAPAARAQSRGPILNPVERLKTTVDMPRAHCVRYWDLPEPLLRLKWREFPSVGLLQEIPERMENGKWKTGIEDGRGRVLGPRSFSYDELGRITAWVWTSGDVDNPMRNQVQTSYAYDESGNLTEVLVTSWDGTAWVNGSRSIYTYADVGQVERQEHQDWNQADWEVNEVVNCSYDVAGRLHQRIQQACASSGSGSDPICHDSDSTRYAYDASGRILLDYGRTLGRGWQTPETIRYTYDEWGRLIEKLDTGREEQGIWSYAYDDLGRLSEEIVSRSFSRTRTRYDYQHAGVLTRAAQDGWNPVVEAWAEHGEVRYEYSRPPAIDAVSRFMGDSDDWSREEYSYDHRDNLVKVIYYGWADSSWVRAGTAEYLYDDLGRLTEYILAGWSFNQRADQFRVRYDYGVVTDRSDESSVPEDLVVLSQNHPNPVERSAIISYRLSRPAWVNLSLFDAMGRQIRVLESASRAPGRYEVILDAAELSSGIYFYRLQAGDAVKTRRMVIAR